jgi:hypothetical protein
MNKLTQGLIAVFAIAINLLTTGTLLYRSWFEPDLPVGAAVFLLCWFIANVALAFVAFGPEAKD